MGLQMEEFEKKDRHIAKSEHKQYFNESYMYVELCLLTLLIILDPIRLTVFYLEVLFNRKFNRDRGCISLGLSGSGSVIHDH